MKGDSRKMRKNVAVLTKTLGKRGQLGLSAAVGAAIAVAITIILGLVVVVNISNSVDTAQFTDFDTTTNTSQTNATFQQVLANINSALVLLAVGIIVLGAAAILFVVRMISG